MKLLDTRKKKIFAGVTGVSIVLVGGSISLYFFLNPDKNTDTPQNSPQQKKPVYVSVTDEKSSSPDTKCEPPQKSPKRTNMKKERVIGNCKEAKEFLNEYLKRRYVDDARLKELFDLVKKFCPAEESTANLSDYEVKLYEKLKADEISKKVSQKPRQLKRLLKRIRMVKPDYVDNPTLESSIGNKLVENFVRLLGDPSATSTSIKGAFENAKTLATPADHAAFAFESVTEFLEDKISKNIETVKADSNASETKNEIVTNAGTLKQLDPDNPLVSKVLSDLDGILKKERPEITPISSSAVTDEADADMEEIIKSPDPAHVVPKNKSSLNLRTQKLLDDRNEKLKKLCSLKDVLPAETQSDFEAWKATKFQIANSPVFANLLGKLKTDELQNTLLNECFEMHKKQIFLVKEIYKHRKDLFEEEAKIMDQVRVANYLRNLKKEDITLTPLLLEWVKGDNFDKIKEFVDSTYRENSYKSRRTLESMLFTMFSINWPHSKLYYYKASDAYSLIKGAEQKMQILGINEPQNINEFWIACEAHWRNGKKEFRNLLFDLANNRAIYEESENGFRGTDKHTEKDKFKNIYEPVNVKIEALDFIRRFRESDTSYIIQKAKEVGLEHVEKAEDIDQQDWPKFSGYIKVYEHLVILKTASVIETADFEQIKALLSSIKEDYIKAKNDLYAFEEAKKLITKINMEKCLIAADGQVECKSKKLQARFRHPQWPGKDIFKPTLPHQVYFESFLRQEPTLRKKLHQLDVTNKFLFYSNQKDILLNV